MKKNGIANLLNKNFTRALKSIYFFPVFLFIVTFVTYGIFIPVLGYYGDDFSLAWLAYKVGSVDSFFTQNRPIFGQIFLAITKLLSPSPWQWHLTFTILRWLLALQIFNLFRSIKSIDERAAYWISLLFLIYPGALIFYQPVTFTGVFLPLTFLISSVWCSIISLQNKKYSWLFRLVGLILELLNLIIIEYFYFLEVLRYVLIWLGLSEKNPKNRLKKTVIESAPNLIMFIALSLYRTINQTTIVHYEPVLIHDLLTNPLNAILNFIPIASRDIFNFGVKAWLNVFQPQSFFMQQGKTTSLVYLLLVAITGSGIYYYLNKKRPGLINADDKLKKCAVCLVLIGLLALFLAGLPPWIAGLPPSIEIIIQNRFSQAFALGAALLIAGLLLLLPKKSKIPIILLTVICAFSIGTHFFAANRFRYDWIEQKRFYWQMAWRFPTLPAPTIIIADYSMVKIEAENPISAAINWIYFHESFGKTQNQIGYYLFYDEPWLMTQLNGLREPLPPMKDHLIGRCMYEKYHLLTIVNEHGCLQVLDPMIASMDSTLPDYLKRGAALSDLNLSFNEDQSHAAIMDTQIFGAELPHDWCYYFEKADLARSKSDWQEMLRLKDEAGQKGFSPTQPGEKMIFLYAYLGSAKVYEALALSREIYSANKPYNQMICRVWEKMSLIETKSLQDTFNSLKKEFACQMT